VARTGNGVTAGASGIRPAASSPNGAAPARTVVVLHIEDNPSNASLVEQILAKRPQVRLVSAAEGRSGLELARQHRPDLVLLDLHLPDLPGDELLYRLKAVPELADTKVVVVSADATPSRIRGMLDQGVEGYLTKPVDVEALLRLVDHEIGAKQGEPR
jgi:CheY-like chemotaxis protein